MMMVTDETNLHIYRKGQRKRNLSMHSGRLGKSNYSINSHRSRSEDNAVVQVGTAGAGDVGSGCDDTPTIVYDSDSETMTENVDSAKDCMESKSESTTNRSQRVKSLLTEAVVLLCKNSVFYNSNLSIEGLLGITVDSQDVLLVNINQTVNTSRGAHVDASVASTSQVDVDYSDNKSQCRTQLNYSQKSKRSRTNCSSTYTPPQQQQQPKDRDSLTGPSTLSSVKMSPIASGAIDNSLSNNKSNKRIKHEDTVVIKTEKVDEFFPNDCTFLDANHDSSVDYFNVNFHSDLTPAQFTNCAENTLNTDTDYDQSDAEYLNYFAYSNNNAAVGSDTASTVHNVEDEAFSNEPSYAIFPQSTDANRCEFSAALSTQDNGTRSNSHASNAPTVICEVCSKLIVKAVYSRHLKTHLGRYLDCHICHRMFNRKDNLKRHYAAVHQKDGSKYTEPVIAGDQSGLISHENSAQNT